MIQIYHNPRCGKSRNCLAFIEDAGESFEIIKYLEQPPTFQEMVSLLKKLNFKPIELVRQKESIWIEKFKNQEMTDDEIIQAMITNPILIERPIVIKEDKAFIARDQEKLRDLL
ncbi:arsenate reductase (glutaredoxin) [Flavobacterium sp. K5-23]|uniref:arsenate reductase (glutaredoxin) n=1 Tax=Flavobacterium sp. K5-23 TaxID=2746225 RepID=UPI00200ED288|nr:arsenate reductase (glutaredoxin) [Flavobacterium sp. K5-23]UQD57324.1 arsenate reductase (glutaredoxin) [Flavobacterium sp. K5-23]